MAQALVLGATGHIGAHIVRALLAEGHPVRAAYRNARFLGVLEGLPVERVRVDLDSLEGLHDALRGCDWVFHAAAYYPRSREPRERAIARGVESTRRTLEVLQRAHPQRVVFTSSAATIRRVEGRPATEGDVEPWPPATRRSFYATVKIAIEQAVMAAARLGLPVVVVSPSVCLGEYDAHAFSGRMILMFARHRLPVYLDYHFNAIYTGDVGVGHVRAAERGRVGERYLLTHRHLTLQEFARIVAPLARAPVPRIRLAYPVAFAAAWFAEAAAWLTRTQPLMTRDLVRGTRGVQRFDGSKALRELALPQTPIEDAIRRAVGWFQQHDYC